MRDPGTAQRRRIPLTATGSALLMGALLLLPAFARAEGGGAALAGLPAGAGREIAVAKCVSCHDATRLATPGYTATGWQDIISRMMNIGVTLTPQEVPQLTAYLTKNFPQQPQPAARVVPGSVRVSFREWAVATSGAFPHDPLATADGAIWYTGSAREPPRAHRSENRRDQGVPDEDPGFGTSRADRRCRRQHLVHGEQCGLHR